MMVNEFFKDHGVFKINDSWATAIQYEAKVVDGRLAGLSLKFMNGRRSIEYVTELTVEEARMLIGADNVAEIERQAETTKTVDGENSKGSLKAEKLIYGSGFTPDYAENTITAGVDKTIDVAQGNAAQVKRQFQRQNNEQIGREENESVQAVEEALNNGELHTEEEAHFNDAASAEVDTDTSNTIPERVRSKFMQVENKFYFPDETPAFTDLQTKIQAKTMHREVVKALVDIAEARGWNGLTVNGTDEFRKAVWEEATRRGIETAGYKPSKFDLAKINEQLATPVLPSNNERNSGKATPVNEIEKGVERRQQKEAGDNEPSSSRWHAGELIEHGKAPYKFDPKAQTNYYVKIKTEKGVETIWGIDLERAIDASEAQAGDRINLNFVGKQAVTVMVKDKDPVTGKMTGSHAELKERNAWNISKAQDFRTQEAATLVKNHPDLAPAAGALAAAKAVAKELKKENGKPLSPEQQTRFVKGVKEKLATAIENGEKIVGPKIPATDKQITKKAHEKFKEADRESLR